MLIKCVLWFLLKTTEGTYIFETQFGFGLDEQMFIRHVQSRWFTLIPAMKQFTGRLEAVYQYFFKDLLKSAKINPGRQWGVQNDYRKLKDPLVRIQLCFLESLESIFYRVPDSQKKIWPCIYIHILHDQLSEWTSYIVRTLMWCFLKADEAGKNRKIAASSRCLQSQRTSSLIRMLRDRSLFMAYTGSGKIDPGPRNFLSLFARAMKFI